MRSFTSDNIGPDVQNDIVISLGKTGARIPVSPKWSYAIPGRMKITLEIMLTVLFIRRISLSGQNRGILTF